MPFITSLGRRCCNSCRKVTPKGGMVYQGEHTGMVWCVECAAEGLHKTPDATETPAAARVLPSSWTKIGPAAVPSWFERGED